MGNPFIENARGYTPITVVSCLHKSLRRAKAHDALLWAIELEESGCTSLLVSRLRIAIEEDLGTLDPAAYTAAHASLRLYAEMLDGKKTGYRLALANLVLTFTRTVRKGRDADCLLAVVQHERHTSPPRPYPAEALDHHTAEGVKAGKTLAACQDESYRLMPEDHSDKFLKAAADVAFLWEKQTGRKLGDKPATGAQSGPNQRLPEEGA